MKKFVFYANWLALFSLKEELALIPNTTFLSSFQTNKFFKNCSSKATFSSLEELTLFLENNTNQNLVIDNIQDIQELCVQKAIQDYNQYFDDKKDIVFVAEADPTTINIYIRANLKKCFELFEKAKFQNIIFISSEKEKKEVYMAENSLYPNIRSFLINELSNLDYEIVRYSLVDNYFSPVEQLTQSVIQAKRSSQIFALSTNAKEKIINFVTFLKNNGIM